MLQLGSTHLGGLVHLHGRLCLLGLIVLSELLLLLVLKLRELVLVWLVALRVGLAIVKHALRRTRQRLAKG